MTQHTPIAGAQARPGMWFALGAAANRRLALLFCVIYAAFFYLWLANGWAIDFSALYYAGYFFAEGQWDQIFAAPKEVIGPDIPDSWQTALAATGHPDRETFPFIYPPWVAAAVSPLTLLFDPKVAMNLVLAANLLLLLGSAALAYRIMSPIPVQIWLWMLACVLLFAFTYGPRLALHLGQAQIFVHFLVLLAFDRLLLGKKSAAGIVLAFAAMIKLSPLFFALIFLWNREWRALIAFCATGAIGVVVAFSTLGWDLHMTYLERLATIGGHIYLIDFAFSFEAFVYQVWDWSLGTAIAHTEIRYHYLKPEWISAASKLCLVASLVLIWAATRTHQAPRRVQRQLLALAFAVPLFMPLGWVHYFILGQILLFGLIALAPVSVALLTISVLCVTQSQPFLKAISSETYVFYPEIIVSVPAMLLVTLVVITAGLRAQANHRSSAVSLTPAE